MNFQSTYEDDEEPYIGTTDVDVEKLEQLRDALGGHVFELDGVWVWELRGAKAASVREELIPQLQKDGNANARRCAEQQKEIVARWKRRNN
jgi:hypothetical protein